MNGSKEDLLEERKTIYELMKEHKKRLIAIKDKLNELSTINKEDGEKMLEYLIDSAADCYYDDARDTANWVANDGYYDTSFDDALEAMIEMENTDRPEVQRALADRELELVILGVKLCTSNL